MSEKKITEDMLVGDIVNTHPEVVETLFSVGMHCIGCPASQAESLADACMVHGLAPKMVTDRVNEAIA